MQPYLRVLPVPAARNELITAQAHERIILEGEEPILVVLEALLRNGQQEEMFRPFDPRVMAVTFRMVIDTAPPLYSANPNLDLALACFLFGVCA
jgi:hypothetical protein